MKILYSTFFYNDLAVAADYLSQFSSSASRRLITLLRERIQNIKSMPEMYAVYSFAPEYRHVVIDRYVVIYRVDKAKGEIYMYRLLHGAQDIPNYL